MAEHPALVGWQTDNEYGCHNTVLSWGAEDLKAFRIWLRHNYQTPERLNEAWGSAFWSMEVQSFDEVALPNLTVTEPNPAARLDYWRFQSQQVAAYDRMQCEIIRRHSPGRWITHNFMGFFNDFDHWQVGDHLDFAAWDSYPIGFAERFPFGDPERQRWQDTSHPDIAPFHHDLYRGVGRGRFWVMEQQPGPVNWAAWNPAPARGMVRLWTLEAHAHGADVVSYLSRGDTMLRKRLQAPSAIETEVSIHLLDPEHAESDRYNKYRDKPMKGSDMLRELNKDQAHFIALLARGARLQRDKLLGNVAEKDLGEQEPVEANTTQRLCSPSNLCRGTPSN